MAAITGIFIMAPRFVPLIARRLPERFRDKAGLFAAGIFKSPSRLPIIIIMSLAIWLSEALRLYLVLQAFGIGSGFLLAVFISQASLILMLLPLSPAGLGLVELLHAEAIIISRDNAGAGRGRNAHGSPDKLLEPWPPAV